jgi:hypothetical protein
VVQNWIGRVIDGEMRYYMLELVDVGMPHRIHVHVL